MTLSNGWPSLSELKAANWDFLDTCGDSWSALADRWESSFNEVWNESLHPGGTEWTGSAANAMQARTAADAVRVREPADQLRVAVEIARRSSGRQELNKQAVLAAVNAALEDGFNVDDDYTISDTCAGYSSYAERDARDEAAENHISAIRVRLGNLVAVEGEIAGDLRAATAGLSRLSFPGQGGDGGAGAGGMPHVTDDGYPAAKTGTAPAAGSQGEQGVPFTFSKGDVIVGTAGAINSGTKDAVSKAVLKAVADGPSSGPGAASPGLLKWFEDPKVGRFELKGFSRVGRAAGVAGAVPAVFSDHAAGNSWSEAITREGVGLGAGMLAGAEAGALLGSVVPGAGTAVGVVVGAGVGALTSMVASKGVEMAWEPVSNAVGSAVHGVKSLFGFG